MFKSDFKVVADYFVQMREKGEYNPGNEVVQHIHEVLRTPNIDKNFIRNSKLPD